MDRQSEKVIRLREMNSHVCARAQLSTSDWSWKAEGLLLQKISAQEHAYII